MPGEGRKIRYTGPLSDTTLYYSLKEFIIAQPSPDNISDLEFPDGMKVTTITLQDGVRIAYSCKAVESGHSRSAEVAEELRFQVAGHNLGDEFKIRTTSIEGDVDQDARTLYLQRIGLMHKLLQGKAQQARQYIDDVAAAVDLSGSDAPITDFEHRAETRPVAPADILDQLSDHYDMRDDEALLCEEDGIPVYVGDPERVIEHVENPVVRAAIIEDDTARVEIPLDETRIKKANLWDIPCFVNPETDRAYSEPYVIDAMVLTLKGCFKETARREYDHLVAIPPESKILSVVFGFGSKEMLRPYTLRLNIPLRSQERAKIRRRLSAPFIEAARDRAEFEEGEVTPELLETHITKSGRLHLEMERFCNENRKSVQIYELAGMLAALEAERFEETAERLCEQVMPQKGVVAFYSKHPELVNAISMYLITNRSRENSEPVIDRRTMTFKLDDLTIHFLGVKILSEEYRVQLLEKRKTPRRRRRSAAEYAIMPSYPEQSLDDVIEGYLAEDTESATRTLHDPDR